MSFDFHLPKAFLFFFLQPPFLHWGSNAGENVDVVVLVGFMQPVIQRQLVFSTGSIFLAWAERSKNVQAYSAAEKQRAKAVDLMVVGFAPQHDVLSL